MWRMIRAGIMGVLFGVVGGALVGQISYGKKVYDDLKNKMAETVGSINSVNSANSVDSAEVSSYYDNIDEIAGLQDILDSEVRYEETADPEEIKQLEQKKAIMIRVLAEDGDLGLGDDYRQFCSGAREYVMTCLASELGTDYQDRLTKDEMRKTLIMKFEYLAKSAEEYAIEYGINVECKPVFEYKYMPACSVNGIQYEAGYYETLMLKLVLSK